MVSFEGNFKAGDTLLGNYISLSIGLGRKLEISYRLLEKWENSHYDVQNY